jgi:tungstate transport system substrate-binding protein
MTRRLATLGGTLAAAAVVVAGCGGGEADEPKTEAATPAKRTMILATTTSTRDSGLLDVLIPAFERRSRCPVKTVAVGSGAALELGERGDADALLVHSPAAEEAFMSEGHGESRVAVMHNDLVLVGPPSNPAEIAGAPDAPAAMARIARARAPFASRADDSGTHAKELTMWEDAGVRPRGDWYVETGQGMGETLTIADQRQAYTLSDRGTFLATKSLDLEVLVEGGAALRNPYHAIVVREQGTNAGCAREFSTWITSPAVQRTISRFGVSEYGEELFFPDARS